MGYRTPKQLVKAADKTGCVKTHLSVSQLWILSFLAGAFIAFGGMLAIMVGCGIPEIKAANPGMQKLIFGSVFPVGLMLVVIAGAELFTGNTACCIPGLLSRKMTLMDVFRNWSTSYIGNFFGAVFVAYFLCYLTDLFTAKPWIDSVILISEGKVNQSYGVLFLKGVGCNWLVCLGVWLAFASTDVISKMCGIWFPIMAFVSLGFEHCIANMFFIPTGIFYGADVTWIQFFVNNIIPVTAGNILGGAFFVGAVYWYVYDRD